MKWFWSAVVVIAVLICETNGGSEGGIG